MASAVPDNWVSDNVLFWPQHLKGAQLINAIKLKEDKGPDWASFPCRILFKDIAIYKDALKRENSAQYFSNTEEEAFQNLNKSILGTRDFNNHFDSQLPNSEEFIETQCEPEFDSKVNTATFRKVLPGMRVPTTSTHITASTSYLNDPNEKISPLSKSSTESSFHLKKRSEECGCCKQILKEVQIIKSDNKDIKAMLSLCMKKINTLSDTDAGDENDISLPISSTKDFVELNNRCKESSFANKLIKQLSFYHLSDEKSSLRKILQEIATDNVFLAISWKGTTEKTSVSCLNELITVIIKVIKKTFKNFSSATFENSAKAWIRHAAERSNRRKEKEKEV